MQLVTDRHSVGDNTEESGQMQQPGASSSSLQRRTDQQFGALSGDPSQHVYMDQSSQHDHMGQLSQQSRVHQMSRMLNHAHLDQQQHDPSDGLQNQSCRLDESSGGDDQVQLSCSLDEDLSSELDLQSSAASQLMGTTAVQDFHSHIYALPDQSLGLRVSEAPQEAADDESQIPLAVRTEKDLLVHVRTQCMTVQEEMTTSPSAAHGRRKQARLDSTRCLKF